MKQRLMQFIVGGAMVAAMAGSVQAAQKTAAKKPGPVLHIPDMVDIECAIYRWAYRNWHPTCAWRSGPRSEPQNKKDKPGELSE